MKKILLATTALVASGFVAGAHAEVPKVTVGGFANFEAGFISDDLDSDERGRGFRNDTEINFNVDGVADSGLRYGAVIALEADVTSDEDDQGENAARTYLYLEGGWGRVEMGSTEGVDDLMKVDASTIARASGGIDGSWRFFANSPTTDIIARPDLPLAYGMGNGGPFSALKDENTANVNKINYFTPNFSGFQGGISYAPDSADRGQVVTMTDTDGVLQSGDNFLAAIRYAGEFSGVRLELGATGEFGDTEGPAGSNDLAAWQFGGLVGFSGFSVAASYADWDDSYTSGTASDDSNFWTAGAAYENGPFGVSVTYLDSQKDFGAGENEVQNVVIGADWKMAEGFVPFVEASFYEIDDNDDAESNDGSVFIVGANFGF